MDKKLIDEQKLIEDCKRNKASAQKRLYDLYSPRMFGVCVRYISDRDAALDILQEGFIKLFTKINSYTEYAEGSFYGWARRIFINTALEMLRQQDVLRFSTNIDDFNEAFEDNNASAIDKISEKDLLYYISELPEGYRTVFNLYVIEGYSHAEIGTILNIEESTSRSQFSKARKLLREKIEKIYG
jgi:RNA polymerase sigma-70 factor (ECF subfamily)